MKTLVSAVESLLHKAMKKIKTCAQNNNFEKIKKILDISY
jgi:hypothetical protein